MWQGAWHEMRKGILLAALVSVCAACAIIGHANAHSAVLPQGTWGGEHIQMDVSAAGADLQFDCANGHIDAPLTIDRAGGFHWKGTYRREHGAAVDAASDRPEQMSYSGKVASKKMTLRVEWATGGTTTLGPYTLMLGDAGHIAKCM
jgi:hypothetical protein